MPHAAPFDLTGRVALVTGASGGLGAEFVAVLREAGARVAGADLAAPDGPAEHAVACDITDPEQVEAMVAGTVRALGGLDVLVNCAGIGEPRSVRAHQVRLEDWRRVMSVDLDGVFLCCRAALPVMLDRGAGKIVNVASMYGLAGGGRVAPVPGYATAKGGVVNLTRELGLEYAASGIQVNALCPGYVSTGLSGGVLRDPEFVERLNAVTPMGRIAQPADLRGALLFLASAASDFMTGQTLVLDGGCLAG
ncbi:MAG TPA: SDR family oxidoreductase [Pseudonocardia sp.]